MKPFFSLIFITIVNFLIVCECMSQISEPINVKISQRAADTIARRSFAKMVSGSEDIVSIANYLSFVPSDGKFTLSGNYFLESKNQDLKKRRHEYFAIGFNAAGSIVDGTVATLFDQGKLNTNTNVGIKFSWRINMPNVGSLVSEDYQMDIKRKKLEYERDQRIDSIKNAISLLPIKLQQIDLQLSETKRKMKLLILDTLKIRNLINTCSNNDSCKLKFTDSLISVKMKIYKQNQKIIVLDKERNSLDLLNQLANLEKGTRIEDRTEPQKIFSRLYGINNIGITLEDTLINKTKMDYEEKIISLELARQIQGMNISWLSLIFDWNRIKYRTYYDNISFEKAITKNNFSGFKVGVQTNIYSFNKPFRKANLINFAIIRQKTNNLDDLTSSKVVVDKIITDGLSSHKSSTEYNVFTDSVEMYLTWKISFNCYNFTGKNLSFGWHFFGLADFRNTKKNIYDLGAGIIWGLNAKDSKHLFNLELFSTYKDIAQELVEEDTSFWEQLQFGVSVAIPFMINKN